MTSDMASLAYKLESNTVNYCFILESLYELVVPITRADLRCYVASKMSLAEYDVKQTVNNALVYGIQNGFIEYQNHLYNARLRKAYDDSGPADP